MTVPATIDEPAAPSAKKRPRIGLRLLRTLLLIYVGVIAVLYLFEHRLVFLGERHPAGEWALPAGAEEVEITTPDATRLVGWYFPHDEPQAVILFHHGNGGNVTNNAPLAALLRSQLRASVLIYDYRSYGKSDDVRPSEQGVLIDARAARAWLAKRAGVAEESIYQFGESLGGGVAVDLAARDGAPGLATLWTFTSLTDVGQWRFPIVPVRWFMRNRLASIEKIGDYHGPFLHVHGDADSIVPYRFGRRLFEAANAPKRFVHVDGGEHNEMPPEEFFDAAAEMIAALGENRTPWIESTAPGG